VSSFSSSSFSFSASKVWWHIPSDPRLKQPSCRKLVSYYRLILVPLRMVFSFDPLFRMERGSYVAQTSVVGKNTTEGGSLPIFTRDANCRPTLISVSVCLSVLPPPV